MNNTIDTNEKHENWNKILKIISREIDEEMIRLIKRLSTILMKLTSIVTNN